MRVDANPLAFRPSCDRTLDMGRPRTRRGPRGRFADRFRAARAARGLTQEGAAGSLGVGIASVARWEAGTHRPRGIVLRVVEEWIVRSPKGGSSA